MPRDRRAERPQEPMRRENPVERSRRERDERKRDDLDRFEDIDEKVIDHEEPPGE